MTITLDIKPEVEAELARQAAAQGRAIEAVVAALLEGAVHPESTNAAAEATPPERRTGQALIDAFGKSAVCRPTKRSTGCSAAIPRPPGRWTFRERLMRPRPELKVKDWVAAQDISTLARGGSPIRGTQTDPVFALDVVEQFAMWIVTDDPKEHQLVVQVGGQNISFAGSVFLRNALLELPSQLKQVGRARPLS